MRIVALALVALVALATLTPAPGEARQSRPAPVAVAVEDVSLGRDAAPFERVVTAAEYAARGTRLALDVRYGPADSTFRSGDATVWTWHADAEARDSSMRAAGIGRITVVQTMAAVRIALSPIARTTTPVVMASAN